MKKLIFLLISFFCFIQCKKNDAIEIVDIKKSVDLNIERFDKLYAAATPKTLPELKNQYPFLFPTQFPDSIWYAKLNDPIFKELNVEVRFLMSARNSGQAFDLRCDIRENMIAFIRENYPDSLPKTRLEFNQSQKNPFGQTAN